MERRTFHPKAYLSKIRNVTRGLTSRTRIITAIEKGTGTAAEIAEKSRLTYGCTLYHLRSMSGENLVTRSGKRRRSTWFLTEYGQQRLTE